MPPMMPPLDFGMTEAQLHQAIVNYLRAQYPNVMFRTDFSAGVKMSIGQAKKHKGLQSNRAWPDLFIAEPRGGWFGLFIELKRKDTPIFLKTGGLTTNKHIREQMAVLDRLDSLGYCTSMCAGFDIAKAVIDEYLVEGTTLGSTIA